ncbi:hypothetical protein ACTHQ4_02235 [Alkalicoccobacillus gibsonii]|uniref:hypothetical protein n=1 Tax=Alkalicoccobacillus gibsonii TaxID=79881 RepID=UPI003F7CD0A5
MSLTKEALHYLAELGIKPEERIHETSDGRLFSIDVDGQVREILPTSQGHIAKETLMINTLSGLVNYIKANIERKGNSFLLHVEDEKTVSLNGLLEEDGRRETLVKANAIIPSFSFNRFINAEEFIISFQSKFVPVGDRDILLKVIGNVTDENVKSTGDDGISQKVEVKQGIASKAEVLVPNPVQLAPYRTFIEVEQPISEFVFRMQQGPAGAIFEADGGAWRNEAIANIRDYLFNELDQLVEEGTITIIA